MSTPYKHFWIIVVMTAGAVIMANISAKRSALPGNQAGSFSEQAKPVGLPENPKRPTIPTTKTESTSIASVSTSNSIQQPQESQTPETTKEYRAIDIDIKRAFDQVVATTTRPDVTSPTVDAPTIEKPVAAKAPPLETRELSPSPKIFEQATTPTAGGTAGMPEADALTTTNLNMREGPSPKYLLVEVLATATPVRVFERQGDWVHVRSVPSGQQGWVNGKFLARKPAF
ncbi:SH3 domain-containing protein [Agrobacterium rhizogenes]|nr:SH3 domain-containing protein [Rhizobium rhizogenes]NTH74933.1 SH3 domain-containing protein [Rhizobium rhizogenes]